MTLSEPLAFIVCRLRGSCEADACEASDEDEVLHRVGGNE